MGHIPLLVVNHVKLVLQVPTVPKLQLNQLHVYQENIQGVGLPLVQLVLLGIPASIHRLCHFLVPWDITVLEGLFLAQPVHLVIHALVFWSRLHL